MPSNRQARAAFVLTRRSVGAAGLCAAAACLLAAPTDARSGPPSPFEYLHIEANEDAASGGHAALRAGEQVYHFQRGAGGWLRLVRVDWERFSFRYRVAMNRGVRSIPIAATDAEQAEVEAAFDARLQDEARDFARLDELRADLDVSRAWRERAEGGEGALWLRGAGFFAERATQVRAPELLALHQAIEGAHGAEFVKARRTGLQAALRGKGLTPLAEQHIPGAPAAAPAVPAGSTAGESPAGSAAIGGSPGAFATPPAQATQIREAAEALLALDVIERAPPLRANALLDFAQLPPLDAAERESLEQRAVELHASLVRLAASRRPDWGYPLLLGAARLAALHETLRTGHWSVLDPLVDASVVFRAAELARVRAPLANLALVQRGHVDAWRAKLARVRHWSERDASGFEATLARWHALDRALVDGADLRARAGAIAARAPGRWRPPVAPALDADELARRVARAEAALRAHEDELDARYGYDLLERNCATELFRLVERAAPRSALARLELSGNPRGFWPLLAQRAVRSAAPQNATPRDWPSWRREQLAELYEHEPAWRVALRESNALTSTLHEPSPLSSTFLFYTDDALWTRPLRGAANLVVGLAQTAVGLLAAPLDRGVRLRDGLRGTLMSAPELVFVNLRKGSYPFALPERSGDSSSALLASEQAEVALLPD